MSGRTATSCFSIKSQTPIAPARKSTYYIACFHVSPRRLLTAAPMLKTRDVNQKPLTLLARLVFVDSKENCMVVAVTALKKVATVDRFSRFVAACFCAKRMVGTPK